MNREEHIPEEISLWLKLYDYSRLSAEQRSVVSQFFSEEEYTRLRAAIIALEVPAPAVRDRKEQLLQHFDNVHAGKKRIVPLRVWQAAAVLLLLLNGCFLFLLLKPATVEPQVAVTALPQDKETEPTAPVAVVVHDTVYIQQEQPVRLQQMSHPVVANQVEVASEKVFPIGGDNLAVLGVDDADSRINDNKNNSIATDSFAQNFHFVSL